MPVETFPQRLKRIRTSALDSQHEAARKLGISEAYFWRLENGRTRPSRHLVERIGVVYQQDPGELWALVETETAEEVPTRVDAADLQEILPPEPALTQLVFWELARTAGRLGATTRELMETVRDGLATISRNEITVKDTNAIRALIQQLQGQLALAVEHRNSTGANGSPTFTDDLGTLGARGALESFYATIVGDEGAVKLMDMVESGIRPKVFISRSKEPGGAVPSVRSTAADNATIFIADDAGNLRPLTNEEALEERAREAQFAADADRFVRDELQRVCKSEGWGELSEADLRRIPPDLTYEQIQLLCWEFSKALKRWDSEMSPQPSLFSPEEIRPPVERVINEAVCIVLVKFERAKAEERRDEICELWTEAIDHYFDQYEEYVGWCIRKRLPILQIAESSTDEMDFLNIGPGDTNHEDLIEQIDHNIGLLYYLSGSPGPQS